MKAQNRQFIQAIYKRGGSLLVASKSMCCFGRFFPGCTRPDVFFLWWDEKTLTLQQFALFLNSLLAGKAGRRSIVVVERKREDPAPIIASKFSTK